MPITPITANALFELNYVVNLLSHKTRMYVDASPGGTEGHTIDSHFTGGTDIDPLDLATMYWGFMNPFYPAAVAAPSYVLYLYSGVSYIPVASGTAGGGAGTNPGSSFAAGQLTVVFKDASNRRIVHDWLESALPVPGKQGTTSTNAALQDFIDDMIDTSGPGHLSDFVVGRGNASPIREVGWTSAFNKKLRRQRAL